MKYFYVDPEVAGGLGSRTVMDRSVHPPLVARLHYHIEGWLGDVVLESFPCFIVTLEVMDSLREFGATGVDFDDADISISAQFKETHPDLTIPHFVWMKIAGQASQDDFGAGSDGRMIVSEAALELLRKLGIAHALIEPV